MKTAKTTVCAVSLSMLLSLSALAQSLDDLKNDGSSFVDPPPQSASPTAPPQAGSIFTAAAARRAGGAQQ